MSSLSATPGTTGVLDEHRLRAGLRLFLPASRADAACASIIRSSDRLGALRTLAADLNRERQLQRLTGLVPIPKRPHPEAAPFAVPGTVSTRAVVALVAHLALQLDGEQLEDAFGVEGREVGEDLLQARSLLSGVSLGACREGAWLVGRYRGRALDPDDRVRLLSHLSVCDACRGALEMAQQVDATFMVALERELDRLKDEPLPSTQSSVRRLGAMPLAAGAFLGVLAVVIGLSVVGSWFSEPHEPVPLFTEAAVADAPLDGWLLQVSPIGYLEAINLSTGQKRGLDSGDLSGVFSPFYRVSQTHIAAWRPSDGQRDDVLTIGPIGGQVRHRLSWNRRFVYWYPSGWLDDDTLLIVKSPERMPNEDENTYIRRMETESQLVAFDAITGGERLLMTGNLAAAYPSPDGSMLAIVPPIDRRWPGDTLELRPFDGRSVGEPVVRIEHRVVSDGYWLPDSSAYVTSVIADESVAQRDWINDTDLVERGVRQVALERIGRDGSRAVIVTTDVPETVVPLAISPDGKSVVYQLRQYREQSRFAGVPDFTWQCYRQPLAGGERELLVSGSSPERVFHPVWSPDGTTLVMPIARAFPLSTDGRLDQPLNPNATTLVLFDAGWQPGDSPKLVFSSGRDLHGWVPADRIDLLASFENNSSRSLAVIDEAEGTLDMMSLTGASVVSERGDYIVLTERDSRYPVIWNVAESRRRRLVAGTTDLAWFNGGRSTIGVVRDRLGEDGSRIIVNAADISRSSAFLDHRVFDPAGLGGNRDQHYRTPLVSPTGTAVSFFVDNQATGQVSLWLDTGVEPAIAVTEWHLPADRVIDPPLVARWVREDTLLFVQPDDWSDGVPKQATLYKLTLAPDGGVVIQRLVSFDAQRGAAGVVLAELALSPDASQFAYRLRHLDTATTDSDSDDTLHVTGTDDLSRAIELARGGYGEGLAWTSDGTGITAGVRGRIALFSPDGRDLEYLSPRGVQSAHPRLVGDQIWFEAVDDSGGEVWQAAVD